MKIFGIRPASLMKKLLRAEHTYYYYSSREEYYKSLFREENLKNIYKLVDKNLKTPFISNQAIKFRDIPFGTPLNDVQKTLGTPRYKINNSKRVENHQVIFYKFKLGGYRAVAQLHFLDNFFFYGSYTFKELNTASLRKIETVLDNKYFSSIDREMHTEEVVADADNNRLFVKKGLYLTIKYVSGDRKFHDTVVDQLQLKRERKQQSEKQHHESLEGLL